MATTVDDRRVSAASDLGTALGFAFFTCLPGGAADLSRSPSGSEFSTDQSIPNTTDGIGRSVFAITHLRKGVLARTALSTTCSARLIMASSGDVLRLFYDAVIARDFAAARRHLSDDLVFVGLFETYRGPDAYLSALTMLMGIVSELTIKTIISEGDEVAVFMQMKTSPPIDASTLVAEWHRLENSKISHVESAFDGRPFAVMFDN